MHTVRCMYVFQYELVEFAMLRFRSDWMDGWMLRFSLLFVELSIQHKDDVVLATTTTTTLERQVKASIHSAQYYVVSDQLPCTVGMIGAGNWVAKCGFI